MLTCQLVFCCHEVFSCYLDKSCIFSDLFYDDIDDQRLPFHFSFLLSTSLSNAPESLLKHRIAHYSYPYMPYAPDQKLKEVISLI